jgi:hypothetical protein
VDGEGGLSLAVEVRRELARAHRRVLSRGARGRRISSSRRVLPDFSKQLLWAHQAIGSEGFEVGTQYLTSAKKMIKEKEEYKASMCCYIAASEGNLDAHYYLAKRLIVGIGFEVANPEYGVEWLSVADRVPAPHGQGKEKTKKKHKKGNE